MASSLKKSPDRFLNRELSWLDFNMRVLEEAQNPCVPLLERLRFLSITDSNLKEFYMVRVAGLKAQVAAGIQDKSQDGRSPQQQLAEINERAGVMIAQQSETWKTLRKSLVKEGVDFTTPEDLSVAERKWLLQYYRDQIFPVLTPLAIDPGHPFPFIPNLGFAMVMALKEKGGKGEQKMSLLPVPQVIPRFIEIPGGRRQAKRKYVLLEDVVRFYLPRLLVGFDVLETGVFNIVRDSEVDIQEDAEDLVRSFESALKRRKRGSVIRLVVGKTMPKSLRKFIIEKLEVSDEDIFERPDLLALKDVSELITSDKPHLLYEPLNIRFPERIMDFGGDSFEAIKDKDIVIHHPYESFDAVVRFLEQAARDPNVVTIKQTLYRTSKNSPIVNALIEAAEAGKSVTALIEIAARFDEEANIRWARDMERAGIQVVYGPLNLKTHAKISLVVRREENALQSYVHFGTGNYHPITAKVYTDLSFFTCQPVLCRDAARLFNFLTGYAEPERIEELAYAPKTLRSTLIKHINAEIKHAKAGRPAQIWAKMNSLLDPGIIDAFYKASEAGVKIDLVVRGICALRPGVKGLSENIKVKSIVGRFLEHSRIICFGNGQGLPSEDSLVFMTSADLMPRNLDWRVEALVPITNATVRQQVQDQIMLANLLDNTNSWRLKASGEWARVPPAKVPFSAHKYFMENPSLSGRGTALHTQPLPPKLKLATESQE